MSDHIRLAPLLLSCDEVAHLVGVNKRTIWRMTKEGKFPQPVRWNRKLVRWKSSVVEDWLANAWEVVKVA